MTNERREALTNQIVALFDQGLSDRRIAAELVMDEATVRTTLRRCELICPKPRRTRGDRLALQTEAVRLHREGKMSPALIADRLGISKSTLYAWWREMAYDPLGGGEERERINAEVRRLFEDGYSPGAVARHIDLPRSVVFGVLVGMGLIDGADSPAYAERVQDGQIQSKQICGACGEVCAESRDGLCPRCRTRCGDSPFIDLSSREALDAISDDEVIREFLSSDGWWQRNTVRVKRGDNGAQ